MIVAVWHRFFDSREHRRAREVAEANYSQALVRVASETKQVRDLTFELSVVAGRLEQMRRERDALAETVGGHNGLLHEELTNSRKACAAALDTISALRRELEQERAEKDPRTIAAVAARGADVAALPPALTRDRENATRLSVEVERLRVQNENLIRELREARELCEKEHR